MSVEGVAEPGAGPTVGSVVARAVVARAVVARAVVARAAVARAGNRESDRGSVTAELAAALPAIILLLLAALTGVAAVGVQVRCVDAAAQAAGTAARGGDGGDAGRRTAPAGATVSLDGTGDAVRATVRAPIRPFGRHLPGFSVGATAVAMREPGSQADVHADDRSVDPPADPP